MWYQIRQHGSGICPLTIGISSRQVLSKLILIAAIVLIVFIGWDNFTTQPALASIRQMSEAPGQMLIQSRHTLKDNQGNSWQVVLFKRIKADGASTIHLRLVDFPGLADFAHPQPLTITTNKDSFEAEDVFAEQAPAANVGEFDVRNVLSKLPVTQLNLSLPLKSSNSIKLSVPSEVVLEWQELV